MTEASREGILIGDKPTAALGPQETAQVGELFKQLKVEGIFLISHDIHDVFDLAGRVSVMKTAASSASQASRTGPGAIREAA